MAWLTTKTFNFRKTTAFVTDGTNQHVVQCQEAGSAQDNFTTTASIGGDSVDYGFTSTDADVGRDRSTSPDVSLAGVCQRSNGGVDVWKCIMDVSGSHDIGCALGDYGNAHTNVWLEIYDDTTLLWTVSSVGGTIAQHFLDATGVDRTAAAWPGSQALKTLVFTTNVFVAKIGNPSVGTDSTCLASLSISPASGGGSSGQPSSARGGAIPGMNRINPGRIGF